MITGDVERNGQNLFDDTNYGTSVSINNISGLSVVMYYRDGWKEAVQRDERTRISPNKYAHIYIDDMKRGGIGRVRAKVKEGTSSGRYAYGGNNKLRIYFVRGNEQAIKEMYETLGCKSHHVHKTSDLPKPDNSGSYSDTEIRTKIAVWNGSISSWKPASNWDDVTKDLKEGGYFVEINRYKFKNPKKQYGCFNSNCGTLDSIVKTCAKLGIDIDKIYGVKTAVMGTKKFRDLQKAGVWVNIFDKAEEIALDQLDRKGYRGIIGLREGRSDLFRYGTHHMDYDDVLAFSKLTETDNDLKNFMKLYEEEQVEDSEEYKAVLTLMNCVDIKVEGISNGIKQEDFEKAEKALWEKYPLVKDVCQSFCSSKFEKPSGSVKELARYVDFIEKGSKDEN